MYQVLFTIEYKNKIFTIFNTTYNRKTFLELNDKGEYIYPTLEDFMELHDIYNSKKEVLYDIKLFNKKKHHIIAPLKPGKKVTFKEMVIDVTRRVVCAVMVATLGVVMVASLQNIEFVPKFDGNTFKITVQIMEGAYIDDTEKLDEILGYKEVSKETIIEAINTNEKIPDSYKDDAIKLLEYLTNKYPNCDMRIYYENIKRMKIVEKGPHQYLGGQFTPKTVIIDLYSGRSKSAPTHELGHASHHIILGIIYPIYRTENFGFFLDEAYTNKITAGIYGQVNGYFQQGKVLDYFLSCVPYTYYDYERFGIQRLITMLEEKYPNVDINYIVTTMDAITDTLSNEEITLKIEEVEQLMDTFFDICLANIDINSRDIYKPFENFIRLIDYKKYPELVSKYFNYYNNILLEKGVSKEVLLETSASIVENIRQNKMIKTSFREYLTTIDKESIKEEDLYADFRKFAEKYSGRVPKIEDVLDILDIYNDFLYCSGFNAEQTINREDIENVVKNYQYIKGAVVLEDGTVYPWIERDEGNYTFNVIGKDNKITQILAKRYQCLIVSDYSARTARSFLNYFGIDKPGSQKFWYRYFKLSPIEYKTVPFYMDGELVCEKQAKDVYIQFKTTKDGSIGFVLSDGFLGIDNDGQKYYAGEVYYTSSNIDEEQPQQPFFPLSSYIRYLDAPIECEKIELSEILNKGYLEKTIIASSPNEMCSSSIFNTLFYNSTTNTIEIHPRYVINTEISVLSEKGEYEQKKVFGAISGGYLSGSTVYYAGFIVSEDIGVSYEGNDTTKIYFEEVLRYYGLLNPETETYEFTDDEMCDLYKQYILELNEKNISQPIRHGR